MRAFIVEKQRPLQAVRLLQKEREERDTDENFTNQKEEIIELARKLDIERDKYREEQQALIQECTEKQVQLE